MLDAHIATLKSSSYSAKIATITWCKGTYMTEDVDYIQMSGRPLLLESDSNLPVISFSCSLLITTGLCLHARNYSTTNHWQP